MARKFNLTISEGYHAHDVFMSDPITTSLIDLVIADDALFHDVEGIVGSMTGKRLVVEEIWHDHIVNVCNAYSLHSLTVAECYHLNAGDALTLSLAWAIRNDPSYPPKLPVIELTIEAEKRLYGLEDGSPLPAMTVAMSAGMRCGRLELSDMELSATAQADTLGSVDKRIGGFTLSARGGVACGDMRLPVPQLAIAVTGADVGRLTKTMPGFSISAIGTSETMGVLEKRMPTLTNSMSMTTVTIGMLSANISTLISGTVAGAMIQYGTLTRSIPPPIVGSMTGHQQGAAASITFPTLITAGVVGVGAGGQGGDQTTTMSDTSHFENYVLRHSRWAA